MPLSRRGFLRVSTGASLALGAWPARAAAPKIRIGQIGTGHAHAAGKMEALRKSPDFEVVGIVEPDARRREAAEKTKVYEGLPWLGEEELLGMPGLRAVAVETIVGDLLPTGARCVAAGKHLHLDKPAGESLAAFEALLADSQRRHLTVQMGYMFRYNPAFECCVQLVREGALGEIFSIDAVMSKAIGPADRRALLPYQGGSMFELGCHVIDSVVLLLGRPQRVTAYNRGSAPDNFADNQLAVLEYPRATVAIRSALLEIEGGPRRQFVVCGTRGTFDIHPLEPAAAKLALDEPRAPYLKGYQDLTFPRPSGRYDAAFEDLAKIIRGEKSHEFSIEHDLAVQETVLLASGLDAT